MILLGVAAGVVGLVLGKVLLIEGSLLLVPALVVYRERTSVTTYTLRIKKIFVNIGEGTALSLAALLAFFPHGYERLLPFFIFAAAFYLFMFVETLLSSPFLSAYVLKWVVGQAVMFGSFESLYPEFVAVDSYRDLNIASHVVNSGGGLPHYFTNLIWYNFSPTAPLAYGITSLVSGASIVASEEILGFFFIATAVLLVGAISYSISGSKQFSLMAIWLGGILPFVWTWSTWPIPETFATVFALIVVLVSIQPRPRSSIPTLISIFVVNLTHGGIALLLIVLLLSMYLFSRQPAVLRSFVLSCVSFVAYLALVSVANTSNGFVTLLDFFNQLVTPQSLLLVPNISGSTLASISAQAAEMIANYYWYVFVVVVGLLGLDRILKSPAARRKEQLGLVVYVVILLATAVVFLATGSSTEAPRYVGLLGYVLSPLLVTFGIIYLLGVSRWARLFITISLAVMVAGSVAYGLNSPDLWQNVGQDQFAIGQRLGFSTTIQELSGQLYINTHDRNYQVIANYLPEAINLPGLQHGGQGAGLNEYGMLGVDVTSTPRAPYIALLSDRASAIPFQDANPASRNATLSPDVVYSNPSSEIRLVT